MLTTFVRFIAIPTHPIRRSKAINGDATSSNNSTVLLGIWNERSYDRIRDDAVRDSYHVGVVLVGIPHRDCRQAGQNQC